jgi:membrane protein implicated in regulation of membrane protease activity
MCFAFFIATGSFFLGQQDVLPEAVRGSPALFVLAFAPLAVMLFWLFRLRVRKRAQGPRAAAGGPLGEPI